MEFKAMVEFLIRNGFPEDHADLVVHCAQAGTESGEAGSVKVLRDGLPWEVTYDGLFRVTVG